jgi:hypothetical protein
MNCQLCGRKRPWPTVQVLFPASILLFAWSIRRAKLNEGPRGLRTTARCVIHTCDSVLNVWQVHVCPGAQNVSVATVLVISFTPSVWELASGRWRSLTRSLVAERKWRKAFRDDRIKTEVLSRFLLHLFRHYLYTWPECVGPKGTAGRNKSRPLVGGESRSKAPGSTDPLLPAEVFVWLLDTPRCIYRTDVVMAARYTTLYISYWCRYGC